MPPNEIEEVWHGLDPPYLDLFAWVEGRSERPSTTDPAPFRTPMLAHAIDEADFAELDPGDFRAEWKWDGIRVQAVVRRDQHGVTRDAALFAHRRGCHRGFSGYPMTL